MRCECAGAGALLDLEFDRTFGHTSLSGTIPMISKLVNLKKLKFENSSISGIMPHFEECVNMNTLWLYSNSISGDVA